MKEQEEEVAETQAEATDTAEVATDAAAQAAVQLPLALLGALFADARWGRRALAGGAKMLARNLPLVLLLALIGMLFWPTEPAAEADDAEADDRLPASRTAAIRRPAQRLHREAA